MNSEKDRYGDKLRDVEHAREDKYFAERDRELLEKLKRESSATPQLACPSCGTSLTRLDGEGLRPLVCPEAHGWWIGAEELTILASPEGPAALARLIAGRATTT